MRDKAEELSLRFNQALGYDMNAIEFAVKDGRYYGIDLTNYTPDMDYRSFKDAHFPWAVEKMAELRGGEGAVEGSHAEDAGLEATAAELNEQGGLRPPPLTPSDSEVESDARA